MNEQPGVNQNRSSRWANRIWGGVALVGIGLQFWQLYSGVALHPYVPALSLLLIGASMLYWIDSSEVPQAKGWKATRRVGEAIAEGLIVVAVVVVLFELPHFNEFYENEVRKILTTRAYVTKLSADEQRDMVQSVVASRLGQPLDSTMADAYARDLLQQIDEGQYVASEDRYFEKEWTRPERDSTRSENRMTRQVRVFGQKAIHRLDDLVGGQFEYWVVIDKVQCLTIGSAGSSGSPQILQTSEQRKLCNLRLTTVAGAYHIKVEIPLSRGPHTLSRVIHRREAGGGSGRNDIGLDYVTRSITIKFHYPPEYALQIVGHGDLEPVMAGLSTVTTVEPDQNEFDQSFPDRWFMRGASATFLLTALSHEPAEGRLETTYSRKHPPQSSRKTPKSGN